MAIRFICIFGVARTGSNLLFSLLRNCKNLNLKYELFHPKGVYATKPEARSALSAAAGCSTFGDEDLISWRALHPAKTLDVLYEAGGGDPLIFKIFPDHLPREMLANEIIPRGDVGFLILRRRPIESYISIVKAKNSKTYKGVDTSAFHPTLRPVHFLKWADRTREWYDWLLRELATAKQNHAELSYERDVGVADSDEALSHIVHAMNSVGLKPIHIKNKHVSSIQRQDRVDRYQDRVSNWEEFKTALQSDEAHAQILRWAERAP